MWNINIDGVFHPKQHKEYEIVLIKKHFNCCYINVKRIRF